MKLYHKFKSLSSGQLMLEVLMVVALMSMLMVAVTGRISQGVRDSQDSTTRIQAIRHAQDAAEHLKAWRDKRGFEELVKGAGFSIGTGDSKTFCWNSDLPSLPAVGVPGDYTSGSCTQRLENFFNREVIVKYEDVNDDNDKENDTFHFEIVVTWNEGGNTRDVSVEGVIYAH